jgi:hypothetical protein
VSEDSKGLPEVKERLQIEDKIKILAEVVDTLIDRVKSQAELLEKFSAIVNDHRVSINDLSRISVHVLQTQSEITHFLLNGPPGPPPQEDDEMIN